MEAKKVYTKPFMVKERFSPQEYCAGCYVSEATPTNSRASIMRIDLAHYGIVDMDEVFYDHMGISNTKYVTNFEIVNVNVYKYIRKDMVSNIGVEAGTSYDATYSYKDPLTWEVSNLPQYKLIATQMIRSNVNGKFYFIGKVDGTNYGHIENAS